MLQALLASFQHRRLAPWEGGGGSSRYFWVGMCQWDFETLYLTMFSCILRPYSRLDTKSSYPISELLDAGTLFLSQLVTYMVNDALF